MSNLFRIVGFICVFLFAGWLYAEEPEDALDRITAEVVAETGFPSPDLIDQRFVDWLTSTTLADASGELTGSGSCGVSMAACTLPIIEDPQFPSIRDLTIITRRDGTVNANFKVKWKKPVRLPHDLRNIYELIAYDVYLVREDGEYQRYRLNRRLNRNGKYRPPRKIKFRNRAAADYEVQVQAIYDLTGSATSQDQPGTFLANTNGLTPKGNDTNTRTGSGEKGGGLSGGGFGGAASPVLSDISTTAPKLYACLDVDYDDDHLLSQIPLVDCRQAGLTQADVDALDEFSGLTSLNIENTSENCPFAVDCNEFTHLSSVAGLADLSSVRISRVKNFALSELTGLDDVAVIFAVDIKAFNPISEVLPDLNTSSITFLSIADNNITELGVPTGWSNPWLPPDLLTLKVGNNPINNVSISNADFDAEALDLSGTLVTDISQASIAVKSVKSLSFIGGPGGDGSMLTGNQDFSGFTQLCSLMVQDSPLLSNMLQNPANPDGATSLPPHIQVLNLEVNTGLTSIGDVWNYRGGQNYPLMYFQGTNNLACPSMELMQGATGPTVNSVCPQDQYPQLVLFDDCRPVPPEMSVSSATVTSNDAFELSAPAFSSDYFLSTITLQQCDVDCHIPGNWSAITQQPDDFMAPWALDLALNDLGMYQFRIDACSQGSPTPNCHSSTALSVLVVDDPQAVTELEHIWIDQSPSVRTFKLAWRLPFGSPGVVQPDYFRIRPGLTQVGNPIAGDVLHTENVGNRIWHSQEITAGDFLGAVYSVSACVGSTSEDYCGEPVAINLQTSTPGHELADVQNVNYTWSNQTAGEFALSWQYDGSYLCVGGQPATATRPVFFKVTRAVDDVTFYTQNVNGCGSFFISQTLTNSAPGSSYVVSACKTTDDCSGESLITLLGAPEDPALPVPDWSISTVNVSSKRQFELSWSIDPAFAQEIDYYKVIETGPDADQIFYTEDTSLQLQRYSGGTYSFKLSACQRDRENGDTCGPVQTQSRTAVVNVPPIVMQSVTDFEVRWADQSDNTIQFMWSYFIENNVNGICDVLLDERFRPDVFHLYNTGFVFGGPVGDDEMLDASNGDGDCTWVSPVINLDHFPDAFEWEIRACRNTGECGVTNTLLVDPNNIPIGDAPAQDNGLQTHYWDQGGPAPDVPGGPDDLKPGLWNDPEKDGTGWNFYWASEARYANVHEQFGDTYDLLAVWYAHVQLPVGINGNLEWSPAWLYSQLKLAGEPGEEQYYEGALYYPNHLDDAQQPCEDPNDGQCAVGMIRVFFDPADNRHANVDVTINSDNGLAGITSSNFNLGYITEDEDLFGGCTSGIIENPHDHYSGFWWHRLSPTQIDNSFLTQSWMESFLDANFITTFDNEGHPVWVTAVNDPRADDGDPLTPLPCGDASDVAAITDGLSDTLDVRFIRKGINPTLPAPPGYDVAANREDDIGDFRRIYNDTSSFADRRMMGIYTDFQHTIGSRTIDFSIGSPASLEPMEKIANLHDIRYYVDETGQQDQPECEITSKQGVSACHLSLNWFTDAEYPQVTVFLKDGNGNYSRVACASGDTGCDADLYPVTLDFDYSISQQGTYQFELWKYPNQVVGTGVPDTIIQGNAMIAESASFTVVDNLIDGDPAAGLTPATLNAGSLQDHPPHNPQVGTINGSGGVSGGAASYGIGINVPPGRNGMQPSLSLGYNSRGGNSSVGMGWSLAAGGSISRCPATAAQDDYTVGITFSSSDRLCLNGQRLIRVTSGEYWDINGEYRTEIDSFSRITMTGDIAGDNSTNSGLNFVVEHKSGMIGYYGETTASRARARGVDPDPVASWLLSRQTDRSNNSIHYLYQQQGETADSGANIQAVTPGEGETVLTAIAYTGTGASLGNRRVELTYAERCIGNQCDTYESYVGGYRTTQTLLVSNIKTCVDTDNDNSCQDSEIIRDYALSHKLSGATGRLLLTGITENACLNANCTALPSTTFSWGDTQPEFSLQAIELNNAPIIGGADFTAAVWLNSDDKRPPNIDTVGDIDGDGNRELQVGIDGNQYLIGVDAEGHEMGRMRLRSITGLPLLITPAGSNGDFNNDGRSDFLLAMPNPNNADEYEYAVAQWKPQVLWSDCAAACDTNDLLDIRFTGVLAPTITDENGTMFPVGSPVVADFDGDSRNDILLRMTDASGDTFFRIHRELTTTRAMVGNTSAMSLSVTDVYPPASLQDIVGISFMPPSAADYDGDGRVDIVIQARLSSMPERSGLVGVLFNNSTADSFTAANFDFIAPTSANASTVGNANDNMGLVFDPTLTYHQLIDINGDGLNDVVFMPAGSDAGFTDDDSTHSWHYQINTGNRFSNAAMFAAPVDTDSVIGLWRTSSTTGVFTLDQPTYAGLIRPLDWNNNGVAGLTVPVKLSKGACIVRNNDQNSNLVQEFCPAHPDLSGIFQPPLDGCLAPDGNFQECETYDGGVGHLDPSLYEMSMLEFEFDHATGQYSIRETPYLDTGLLGGRTLGQASDLFGDGVNDSYGPVGCIGTSNPNLSCNSTGGLLNELLDGGLAGDGTGLTRNYYRNELVQSNIETLDLLMDVMDGFDRVTSWDYAPLSSNATRPVLLPLYSIPDRMDGNSLFDIAPEDYFYFSSSMYVVSAMHQPNGSSSGFNTTYYGYEEAVYNNKGRGFMGFRKTHTIGAIGDGVGSGNDTWSSSEFNQVFPLAGQMLSSELRLASECDIYPCDQPSGNPLGHRSVTWNDSFTTHPGVYFPYTTGETNETYDLSSRALVNRITVSNRSYDGFGNMTAETNQSEDIGALTTTHQVGNLFAPDDGTQWWLNRMVRSINTSNVSSYTVAPPAAATSQLSKTVSTLYVWDNTHRKPTCVYSIGELHEQPVTSCTSGQAMDSFGDNATRTITSYDTHGNPQHIYVLGSGMPVAAERHTRSFFEGDGYFATRVINAQGHEAHMSYDPREGLVVQSEDPNGLLTRMSYDVFGRETQTWYPLNQSADFNAVSQHYAPRSSIAYALSGTIGNEHYSISSTTDGVPLQVQYLDNLNRVLRSRIGGYLGNADSSDDWIETRSIYNNRGQMTSQQQPGFNTASVASTYLYDALGRVTRKSTPVVQGSASQIRYSHYVYNGLLTEVRTGLSSQFPQNCDTTANNSSTLANGSTICVQRTTASNGWLLSTRDAHNKPTQYWYDGQGSPIAMTDPHGNAMISEYNGLGQRTQVIDPNQGTSNSVVNGLGEVISQSNDRGHSFTMIYDDIGRLTDRSVTENGQIIMADSWLYDFGVGNGLLAETARSINNLQVWTRSYTYDVINYRPTSHTTSFDNQNFTVDVYSDPYFVRPFAITYPNQSLAIYSEYDRNGYLMEQGTAEQAGNADFLYRLDSLSPRGQREQITYGNGLVQQWDHHANNGQMLQTWLHPNSGQNITHITYQYDLFGNLAEQQQSALGLNDPTETYTYDYMMRLTQSSRSDLPVVGTVSTNYSYDALGNLFGKDDYGTGYTYNQLASCTGATRSSPNGVSGMTSVDGGATVTFGYDNNGNMVCDNQGSQMQYDPYNNPTSIMKGSLATFGYDSGGQRYKQGGEQQIIYIDKLYEQRNGSQHQYYVGDYAVITDEGASRELSYLHTDRLGSIIAISDELGNVNQDEQRGYDPFGKPREYDWNDADPTDGSNGDLNGYEKTTRGYTGHEHLNGTNLIHMNGRVYDYNLGRFMSVDPIIQAPANSQSMNPYSYIMNNPLSGTDPSGYVSDEVTSGNSDTGGSGAPSTSTNANSAQRINVSRQSKTGSNISNTKVTVGDGSVTLDRSGNIIATSGNPSAALAAIGQAMAMNASQGSGATVSPTTEDGGGADTGPAAGGSGNSNVDIAKPGDASGNTGGNVSSAILQGQDVVSDAVGNPPNGSDTQTSSISSKPDFESMTDSELVSWIISHREQLGIPLRDGVDFDLSNTDKFAKATIFGLVLCESLCTISEGEGGVPGFLQGDTITLYRGAFTGGQDISSEYYMNPETGRLTASFLGNVSRVEQLVFVLGHEGAHTIGVDMIAGNVQHPEANYYGIQAFRNFRRIYGGNK